MMVGRITKNWAENRLTGKSGAWELERETKNKRYRE